MVCLAGCSGGADPCASFGGQSCVTVEVRGLEGTPLDQLQVESMVLDVDALEPSAPRSFKTPVEFALLPGAAAGAAELTVSALDGGVLEGRGSTMLTVSAGQHQRAVVTLQSLAGGADLAGLLGTDLAGVDLLGVDLAGVVADLSSGRDLSSAASSDLACGGGAPDEDADGLTDACDPCPIDPATLDSDFDGVGDSCDPNPNTAGNHILFFDGFAAGGGQATEGGTTSSSDPVDFSSLSGDFRVEVKMHLASPGPEASAGIIVSDSTSSSGSGVSCIMRHSMSSGVDGVSDDTLMDGNVSDPGEQFARFSTTDATILRLSRKGSTWTCQATVGNDVPVALGPTFAGATPDVHLQASGVLAKFDYLIVESIVP